MKEIWKNIPGYKDLYEISSNGKIKNVKRNKEKKLTINSDGYYIVKLSKENKKKVFLVHRLVAETFLDFNDYKCVKEDGKKIFRKKDLVINHKDENKLNNCVDNLEWCTNKYNIKYSLKSRKKRNIKKDLYEYMKMNNIDNNTINIVMDFFN